MTTWNSVESFDVAAEWEEGSDDATLGAHIWDEEEPRIVICQLNFRILIHLGVNY